MTITPDAKDWTWVLERPCNECGFDSQSFEPTAVASRLRADGARWSALLQGEDTGHRPTADTWSLLEYGCHVRDVFLIFSTRLALMLAENDPRFANWDQDVTAAERRYGEQDPTVVAVELQQAGNTLAAAFSAVEGPQWQRPGRRSNGAEFTVASLARYLVHDEVHHLYDVTGDRYAEGS